MNTPSQAPPLICLLGGSFNPPHSGHFRIAIETYEALSPAKILFLPCSNPPHKSADSLLSFDFRVTLLRAALAEAGLSEHFDVCEVENERSGPSYTVDTLAILAERCPGQRLAFVMGGEDYANLFTWRNWREIPNLADLVVLSRGDKGKEALHAVTRAFWPEARAVHTSLPAVTDAFALPGAGRLLFLSPPLLEISSSLVRERWLEQRRLDFLMPKSILFLLDKQKRTIRELWKSFP